MSGFLLMLTVWGLLPGELWPQALEAGAVALQSDGKIVTVASGGFAVARYSPDGTLDSSFGTGGKVVTRLGTAERSEGAFGVYEGAGLVALQSDGKVVAAGRVDTSFAVVRYLPNGAVDRSFGTDGKVMTRLGTAEHIEDELHDLALQRDGKIVVVGRSYSINNDFTPARSSNDFALARYNPDGSLDSSFGKEGIVTTDFTAKGARPYRGPSYDDARALAIQADGKLVVGGISALARYNPDGSLDASFGTGGDVEAMVRALTLQRDGKIVVAGPEGTFTLARYNPDGSLDTSFGTGGEVTTQIGAVDAADAVTLQADGKLVVVGTSYDGGSLGLVIARYYPNGRLDTSFGSDGKVFSDFGTVWGEIPYFNPAYLSGTRWKMMVQADGKIVVTGNPWNDLPQGFALIRYNPDGSLDTSFGTKGTVTTSISAGHDFVSDLALQADGKIVMVERGGFGLARYNPDGTLDSSFGTGGQVITRIGRDPGVGDVAFALGLQADGKAVVVGRAYVSSTDIAPPLALQLFLPLHQGKTPKTTNDFAVVRYNPDGSLDATLGVGGIVTTDLSREYDEAFTLSIQADGKLVVAGLSLSSVPLLRYYPDGSLDASFVSTVQNTTPKGEDHVAVHALALQPDGKIVAGGTAKSRFWAARYTVEGRLDTDFGKSGIVTTRMGVSEADHSVAYALVLQADGKLVMAGVAFDEHDFGFSLVRYNPDGSLDPSFGVGGKVITPIGIRNDEAHPFGTSYTHKAGCRVCGIAIQTDGKLVVAGSALTGSAFDFAVVRYNPDGSLDPSFGGGGRVTTAMGDGNSYAYGLTIQADGRIVVGGSAGHSFALARYNPDGSLDTNFGAGGKVITPRIGAGSTVQ